MTDTQSPPTLDETPREARPLAALRGELANPLFRNAYALIVNGGISATLGLGYWLIAAHFYSPAEVGQQSAQNQAMMFIGSLTALNLILIRFIPEMGGRTRAFVTRSYAVSTLASATLAVGFLFTLRWWGPSFQNIAGLTHGLIFLASVAVWTMFTMQDGVLTGLRQAPWVLAKNTAFAVVKVGLLIAFAHVFPHDGIAASWAFSAFVLLLPIEALIQRRLVPAHAAAAADRPIPSAARIGRYMAGDYTGSLCYSGLINLIPVVVAGRLEPRMYAYFYMAWVIGAAIDVLAVNMTMSLTVEGSFDAAGLPAACRSLLRRIAMIIVPLAAVVGGGAPLLLGVFGSGYAGHATTLLRLLTVAALPKILIEVYIGVLRVQSRTRLIAILQATRFLAALAGVLAITGSGTVARPGIVVLVVSLATAAAVTPGLLEVIRLRPHRHTAPSPWPESFGKSLRSAGRLGALPTLPLPARLEPWRPLLPSTVAFVVGLACFWIPLLGVDLDRMNGYGLISVLPITTILGACMLTVAFMLTLARARPHKGVLAVQLAVTVISIHGLAPALEPIARFPTVWQHAGFIEYIARTGNVDVGLDARYSWPGFFALMAFVTRAIGVHNLEPILHWSSVVTELLYLVPLAMILRTMRANWRATWFAAWLFVVADWVGQDYLSPQAFGYLLYLLFVAILLNWFRTAPRAVRAPPGRVRRILAGALPRRVRAAVTGPLTSGERPPAQAPAGQRAVLLGLLIVIFLVATASHQLSPFLILFACGALVVLKRCSARSLPVLLGVMALAWIAYLTVGYWQGHLNDIFGGFGDLGANLSSSVGGRISGGSRQLALIQEIRILIAAFIVTAAGLGLLRRRLLRMDDRVALVLMLTPCLCVGMQNYGGEIALRIFFFILPGACLLVAYLFFPSKAAPARSGRAMVAATAAALVVMLGFLTVRFGNEEFERVNPGDVQAFSAMLKADPATVDVVWLTGGNPQISGTPEMPWGYPDMERSTYTAVTAPTSPTDITPILQALQQPGSYFITTPGQENFNEYNFGFAPSYGARMRGALSASPLLRTIYDHDGAVVYTLATPPAGAPQAVPPPQHLFIGTTPLTDIGLFLTPLLMLLLLAREMRRLWLSPNEDLMAPLWRRTRRPLLPYTVLAIPLLAAVLLIIFERFSVLGH